MSNIKNLTERQARKIRKEITEHIGSKQRIWPKRNWTYIVYQPLDYPYVESYEGKVTLEILKEICKAVELEEEPLIFYAGHYRHQRNIPTEAELRAIKYKMINEGESIFV